MARSPGFPFTPRSTAHVEPGDFWAIPTRRGGRFCCGRVLVVGTSEQAPTLSLIAGLLDWCEPDPPTSESIAGRPVLEFGEVHIKTIAETGGELIGRRDLAADGGLEALLGGRDVRDCSGWGYLHIEALAHKHFGRHLTEG